MIWNNKSDGAEPVLAQTGLIIKIYLQCYSARQLILSRRSLMHCGNRNNTLAAVLNRSFDLRNIFEFINRSIRRGCHSSVRDKIGEFRTVCFHLTLQSVFRIFSALAKAETELICRWNKILGLILLFTR